MLSSCSGGNDPRLNCLPRVSLDRWPSQNVTRFKLALRLHFLVSSQQTQNISITCIQRRLNVFDVGPTLYKCYKNVLCLLGKRVGWSGASVKDSVVIASLAWGRIGLAGWPQLHSGTESQEAENPTDLTQTCGGWSRTNTVQVVTANIGTSSSGSPSTGGSNASGYTCLVESGGSQWQHCVSDDHQTTASSTTLPCSALLKPETAWQSGKGKLPGCHDKADRRQGV